MLIKYEIRQTMKVPVYIIFICILITNSLYISPSPCTIKTHSSFRPEVMLSMICFGPGPIPSTEIVPGTN